MKPLRDRILIEKEEYVTSKGGIVIPMNVGEYDKPHPVGIVLEVGEEVKTIKKGDKIIYSKNVETPVEYAGEKYTIILESHVIAIV